MNRARKNNMRLIAGLPEGRRKTLYAMNGLHGAYMAKNKLPADLPVLTAEFLIVIQTHEDLQCAREIIDHLEQFFPKPTKKKK